MNFENEFTLYAYRMSQASQVFLPIKVTKQSGTNAKNQIDGWFNGTAAKNAVAQGYENQEPFSRLLGQTYISAAVVRPTVQNPAATPVPVVQNTCPASCVTCRSSASCADQRYF